MVANPTGAGPATCPRPDPGDERKSAAAARSGDAASRGAAAARIECFDVARQLLRSGAVRQAGFRADLLERFTQRHAPVLFQEGEAHHRQRSATARFFAPRVVTTRYRELMQAMSDRLVDDFRTARRAGLDDMSLELAVAVAAEIVGLTHSARPGMATRLNRFFSATAARKGLLAAIVSFAAGQYRMLSFYLNDVRPAIRVRRRARQEDVVSHLIDQGYSDREILTECLTYGAAGMATTREFIVMAAWHLFERDDLRRSFLDGDEPAQIALLEEVLRLEPVVGALYRRTERALTLEEDGRTTTLAAGTLVAIDIRAANTDPAAAGACPLRIDPERDRSAAKTAGSLMSFGDGPHRCPGATVALQEAAVFLDRLLRVPGVRLERAPTVTWNALIASYQLRNAVIAID